MSKQLGGIHPENTRRAMQAYEAVKVGTDFKSEPEETLETYVADLLANLRHLCDDREIDWDDALRRADMHYEFEWDDDE